MTGTIQTKIDALPATGALVKLLDGTYNIATGLVVDSYQTLKGCGRNTIFTATTADLDIITATGGSGTEKVGILLADFCVDGNAGGVTNDTGIYFSYVDYSAIRNVWSIDNGKIGVDLIYCDFDKITGGVFRGNTLEGILVGYSNSNIIYDNICSESTGSATSNGIMLETASRNIVMCNICEDNDINGIILESASNNTVVMNTAARNGEIGIYVESNSNSNTISLNSSFANSQTTTNTDDDILISNSDYNNIRGNMCRAGDETNKPRYGINILNATANENKVINNDLYDDGFGTGAYNDDGTDTIYVEPGIDDTPVNGETGQPISSNWAFDHNAAVLSTTVHNNNNYFLGYGNETVTDPTLNALVKIPALTAITDPISGLDVSDWYGASGAYLQSDADSDATHIEDDDANFPASLATTMVKWASDAAGTLNTGIGYIHSRTDADTLLIAKFTGTDFAASYYYWIKHSEWVVPVTGIYYVKAAVLFLPSEADKRFEVRVLYYNGTPVPVQLVQGVASSGLTDYEFPAIAGMVSLTANDHLYAAGQHGGTSGTPNIYTSHTSHLPLQAFLLKQTA